MVWGSTGDREGDDMMEGKSMNPIYKLTDDHDRTRPFAPNQCQWGAGVTHTAPGGKLCTAGVIHAYQSPELASLMDPAHANYGPDAHLWRCDEYTLHVSAPDKLGCTSVTTTERVPLSQPTIDQRAEFAIRSALAIKRRWKGCAAWVRWAEAWLDGSDRTQAAAAYAAAAAAAAAYAYAAAAYAGKWEPLMLATLDEVLHIGKQADPIEQARVVAANEAFQRARERV